MLLVLKYKGSVMVFLAPFYLQPSFPQTRVGLLVSQEAQHFLLLLRVIDGLGGSGELYRLRDAHVGS